MELFLVAGCLPSTFHRILGKHDQSSPMKKTLAKGRHLANHMFAEFPPCDTLQTHALPSFSHVAPGKQISPLFSSLFLFHFLFQVYFSFSELVHNFTNHLRFYFLVLFLFFSFKKNQKNNFYSCFQKMFSF